jgi:hypothetical protein
VVAESVSPDKLNPHIHSLKGLEAGLAEELKGLEAGLAEEPAIAQPSLCAMPIEIPCQCTPCRGRYLALCRRCGQTRAAYCSGSQSLSSGDLSRYSTNQGPTKESAVDVEHLKKEQPTMI